MMSFKSITKKSFFRFSSTLWSELKFNNTEEAEKKLKEEEMEDIKRKEKFDEAFDRLLTKH